MSSVAVFEAEIWVKSMYTVYDKIAMKKRKKKRKFGNQINLYINLHLKKILEWNLQLANAS